MPARDSKGRFIKKHGHKNNPLDGIFHLRGFSLLEIVIALAILTSISAGLFVALNPITQINKAQDSKRLSDLQEVRQALSVYYHDHNCYPASLSPFTSALQSGGEWSEVVGGKTVTYMKKLPKDPNGVSYTYTTDTTACPQWNVVFAKLSKAQLASNLNTNSLCPLSTSSGCAPQGFDNTWACVTSGNTNCTALISGDLSNPAPQQLATPTPTPSTGTIYFSMNSDPYFYQAIIYPFPAQPGAQSFSLETRSTNPVNTVTARVNVDGAVNTYNLTKANQTLNAANTYVATWTGSWTISSPITKTYYITPTATDSNGNTASADVVLR